MDRSRNQVSVIIPARNRLHLLARAIRSVQAQVDVDCDLIVVDDGSEPAVADFLHASGFEDVRVLRNDVRRNAAYCRNRGAEAARFPYLAFLDSDDVWFPLHLTNALVHLPDPAVDELYVSRFGSEQRMGVASAVVYSDASRMIFERIGDPRSSVLVCGRPFFDKVGGFDESLEKYQDWDFAFRCVRKGSILLGDATTVFLDTDAAGRMSRRVNLPAARRFLSKHGDQMSEAHRARFFVIMLATAGTAGGRDHRDVVTLLRDHVRLRAFPVRYWPLRFAPKTGLMLRRFWLSVKRFGASTQRMMTPRASLSTRKPLDNKEFRNP
jgi:glycosyltransferase involved in cell wall biosynthesis